MFGAADFPLAGDVFGEASLLFNALLAAMRGDGGAQEATNTPKPALDCCVMLVFAVALFVFNWGTRWAVLEPLAVRVVALEPRNGLQGRREKFSQSASEAIFYGTSFLIGLCVVPRQTWIWPSALWYVGKTSGVIDPANPHAFLSNELKCYILLYLGRYFQGLVSVFLEHKRKDFLEMLIHHSVTVMLIGLSYTHQYNRVGVVVMLLLDIGDVPLHLAKLCKYMNRDGAADVFFVLFGVSFFLSRLVVYPYVVWSGTVEGYAIMGVYGGVEWTAVALLYVLLALQVYWMAMILKVALKMNNGHSVEDIRSDSDEDEGEKKKKA